MTSEGCITKCGGDTGIECPEETICYNDSDCLGCLEICSNGKCVINEDDICNGVAYCDGNKVVSCTKIGTKGTACATNTIVKEDCSARMGGNAYICSEEGGKAECVSKCSDGTFLVNGECVPCSIIATVDGFTTYADADGSDCENVCSGIDVITIDSQRLCAPPCPAGTERFSDGSCVSRN